MKAIIFISGIIGEETSLTDVIRQFKSYEEPTEVEAVIHSEGGNVEQGDAIFEFLNGLKKTMPVMTPIIKAANTPPNTNARGGKFASLKD